MRRLDLIREALQQLNPHTAEGSRATPPANAHISRNTLTELMDCMQYLCFPECTFPPTKFTSLYVGDEAVTEWVMGHVADIMAQQITYAFILHDDDRAVECLTEFKPLDTAQRTPLDWGAPLGGRLVMGPDNKMAFQPDAAGPATLAASPDFVPRCRARAEAIVHKFLTERLPHVRWLLHTDVESIYRNDVAASSPSEVVLCYPGIRCMLHQRVAHQLYLLGVPMNFTRMLTEIAHSMTGIDIHPITAIGHHFFIDHGTGIVIGATAIIGNHVSVYQGVTLGAKSFPMDKKTGELIRNLLRHPILEDNVTVYANAVILGPVRIGKGSTIGGNCWVVRDVPPYSSIVQKSNRVLAPNEKMFLQKDGSGI